MMPGEKPEGTVFEPSNTVPLGPYKSARFLAEKMCALAGVFEMGKYNECAAMLNVVTAENNVEGTFQVAKQLLNNVDTLGDFQKSQLYKHMKFREVENPYTEEMKKIAERL